MDQFFYIFDSFDERFDDICENLCSVLPGGTSMNNTFLIGSPSKVYTYEFIYNLITDDTDDKVFDGNVANAIITQEDTKYLQINGEYVNCYGTNTATIAQDTKYPQINDEYVNYYGTNTTTIAQDTGHLSINIEYIDYYLAKIIMEKMNKSRLLGIVIIYQYYVWSVKIVDLDEYYEIYRPHNTKNAY